ncbi:MAG: hypothetical protein A3D92_03485 [Bacteroidetes bacterium RIFCSPHIGHO2_02_FULL_44_7]|nr:MAG: hypothetical protein A3D92_03485 [Bacteroidetes bacterium RIFCSPHIGHO2_02_FULL_44_7]
MKYIPLFGIHKKYLLLCLVIPFYRCDNPNNALISNGSAEGQIYCSNLACEGTYVGPEFIHGDDVAHQFSNKMSSKVGDKLKELYRSGAFCKVDFSKIHMSTKGMGSGHVTFKLYIPFVSVDEKCAAYTSFDHSGGWRHPPALAQRKEQLKSALLRGEKLDISPLKKTPEGLQEYWIQWKNRKVQSDCAK